MDPPPPGIWEANNTHCLGCWANRGPDFWIMAIHLLSTGRASFSPIEDHANFRNYKKDTVYISFLWGKVKACSSSSFLLAQKKNWGGCKNEEIFSEELGRFSPSFCPRMSGWLMLLHWCQEERPEECRGRERENPFNQINDFTPLVFSRK